jgi:hypothetical protein
MSVMKVLLKEYHYCRKLASCEQTSVISKTEETASSRAGYTHGFLLMVTRQFAA